MPLSTAVRTQRDDSVVLSRDSRVTGQVFHRGQALSQDKTILRKIRKPTKSERSAEKMKDREAKHGLIGAFHHSPQLGDTRLTKRSIGIKGRIARVISGGAPGSGKRK
jgi:hypothetical protein